jgi:hypothetical protein
LFALTVASILNVNKYPPSLEFLLMANGATCVALALAESARGFIARTLAVYGRVPHWGVYVAWAVVVAALWWRCATIGRRKATRTDWWLRFV